VIVALKPAYLSVAKGNGDCDDNLTHIMRDESLSGAAVEKLYARTNARVKVSFGKMEFSKFSKAFIFWRSRTPWHIPDDRFVFRYITSEEVVRYGWGHVIPKSEIKTVSKKVEVNPIGKIKKLGDKKFDSDFSNSGFFLNPIEDFVHYQNDSYNDYHKVVFFEVGGHFNVVAWSTYQGKREIYHHDIVDAVTKKFPGSKIVTTGLMNVESEVSEGRIEFVARYRENLFADEIPLEVRMESVREFMNKEMIELKKDAAEYDELTSGDFEYHIEMGREDAAFDVGGW
jgi:hypothetical protein